jgi:hypothetical protein
MHGISSAHEPARPALLQYIEHTEIRAEVVDLHDYHAVSRVIGERTQIKAPPTANSAITKLAVMTTSPDVVRRFFRGRNEREAGRA